MNVFLFWLIGWFILSIGYYIWKVYIDKDMGKTKKLHAWHAFWIGIWSWIGIIVIIAISIVYGIAIINDWIEEKLS